MSGISTPFDASQCDLPPFEMHVDEGTSQCPCVADSLDPSRTGKDTAAEEVRWSSAPPDTLRNTGAKSPWSVVGETRIQSERMGDSVVEDNTYASFFDSFDDIGSEEVISSFVRKGTRSVTANQSFSQVLRATEAVQPREVSTPGEEVPLRQLVVSLPSARHEQSSISESKFLILEAPKEAVDPVSQNQIERQNADLRKLLLAADESSAIYLRMYEKATEELQSFQKTVSFVMRDGIRREMNLMQRQTAGHNSEQTPWSLEKFLSSVVSPIKPLYVNLTRQGEDSNSKQQFRQSHTSFPDDGVCFQDVYSADWRHQLKEAQQHAYHQRAGPAMESLLLAITADDFNAWQRLLLKDANWNKLRGEERHRWDSLIASKLTEVLRKEYYDVENTSATALPTDGIGEGELEENNMSETSVEGGREDVSVKQIRPETLAPFIRHMGTWYAEKLKDEEVTDANNAKVSAGILEELVCSAIAVFPDSAILLYELAALRSMQRRVEESLSLLTHVMHIDPNYLMCTRE